MIAAANLSMRFGKKVLFENVSVKFSPGRYGLIGANGVGKSTFMKILTGQLEPSTGHVAVDRDRTLGFLRQDHYEFDEYTVLDTVYQGNARLWAIHREREMLYDRTTDGTITDAESDRLGDLEEEFGDLGGYEMEADAVKLLKGLGIEDAWQHLQMKALSGGWKVRVLLAQVLFGKPDVLLLDEPTNHLDMETIDWLVNFLCRCDGTVVVISHDRYFINAVCTDIADLDYQELRLFSGNYDDFIRANDIIMDRMRKENDKKEKRSSELRDFISRFGANASKAKQATARQKELEKLNIEKMKPSSRVAPFIRFTPGSRVGDIVVESLGIAKTYDKPLFKKMDIHLKPTDKLAILGTNGVGKTTLLKCLAGLLKPDTGSSRLGDTIRVSYFPQDAAELLHGDFKALDWLGQFAASEGITETDLRAAMGRMLFSGEDALKPISVLSGGEKARMIMAKMLMEPGNLLVLDEPTSHLDLESIEALNYALCLAEMPVIFVSHDREFVNSVANRIIELHGDGTFTDYPGNLVEYDEWKLTNRKKK